MARYLLLKHSRGAPSAVNDVPMERWTPSEVEAHMAYVNDFAAQLERSGEYVDGQALAPDDVWVRSDGEGRAAEPAVGMAPMQGVAVVVLRRTRPLARLRRPDSDCRDRGAAPADVVIVRVALARPSLVRGCYEDLRPGSSARPRTPPVAHARPRAAFGDASRR
jgi:hypothetical protein